VKDLWINVLGVSAAILSAISLMPQVIRTWRTRSAADISTAYLIVTLTATAIWVGYGTLLNSAVIVVVNIAGFIQGAAILFVKLRYGHGTAVATESR
jgi:MtN3 and saliva related transmembrane protein